MRRAALLTAVVLLFGLVAGAQAAGKYIAGVPDWNQPTLLLICLGGAGVALRARRRR